MKLRIAVLFLYTAFVCQLKSDLVYAQWALR